MNRGMSFPLDVELKLTLTLQTLPERDETPLARVERAVVKAKVDVASHFPEHVKAKLRELRSAARNRTLSHEERSSAYRASIAIYGRARRELLKQLALLVIDLRNRRARERYETELEIRRLERHLRVA